MILEDNTIKHTATSARPFLKAAGYMLKHEDGEWEIYPKGRRGDQSYFTGSLCDAVATARFDRTREFARAILHLDLHNDIKEALKDWHAIHFSGWKDALYKAWYTGNYNRFEKSHLLQRLRNTNGHDVIAQLEIY